MHKYKKKYYMDIKKIYRPLFRLLKGIKHMIEHTYEK